MAQQSILGRIGQLARANINAMIDAAEDPEKMLDQMVRDYTTNIAEAEDAVAQTIGNLRMLEEDHQEALENAREWGVKALAASRKGDDLRASGDTAGADRFDSLAKIALQRQLDAEGQVDAFEPQIAAQTEVVERLKTGLERMRGKLSELTAKRNELVARAKMAEAQTRVHDAVRSIDLMDPTSEVSRFEDKVRREEARVLGRQELQASSLDAQFEALEEEGERLEHYAVMVGIPLVINTSLNLHRSRGALVWRRAAMRGQRHDLGRPGWTVSRQFGHRYAWPGVRPWAWPKDPQGTGVCGQADRSGPLPYLSRPIPSTLFRRNHLAKGGHR